MRAGSAFTASQAQRLERAAQTAGGQTGLLFSIVVGPGESDDPHIEAERLLAHVVDGRPVGAALVFVDPARRQLEIVTNAVARHRLDDQACALAALSMTTSFTVGDLVGGLVNGLRMLADAAGPRDAPRPQLVG